MRMTNKIIMGIPKVGDTGFEQNPIYGTINKLVDGKLSLGNGSKNGYFESNDRTFSAIRSRNSDIIQDIIRGFYPLGLVTSDVFAEYQAGSISTIQEIQRFGADTLKLNLLISNQSRIFSLEDCNNKKIATSYPNLIKSYFQPLSLCLDIIERKGQIEAFVASGCVDVGCDLVSSGRSYRENGLKILDKPLGSYGSLVLVRKKGEISKEISEVLLSILDDV